jgi:hypothetical protein
MLQEKHALGVVGRKHAFAYTADERAHLVALQEHAMFVAAGLDADWFDPGYWRHCAAVALDEGQPDAQRDCIERADTLECGMTHGGETL